eukprot:Platyproteum_vivax@DN2952_c0_g1_i1.p1
MVLVADIIKQRQIARLKGEEIPKCGCGAALTNRYTFDTYKSHQQIFDENDKCSLEGLRNHVHFPPIALLGDVQAQLSTQYYKEIDSVVGPRRHFVILGDILECTNHQDKFRVLCEDQTKEIYQMVFNFESKEEEKTFAYTDLKKNSMIA